MKNYIRNIKSLLFVLIVIFTSNLIAQDHKTNLCILDINVWSGLDYVGTVKMGEYETPEIREKRYQALIAQIKELDPDIIGIHEANLLPKYAKRLAKDIEYVPFYHLGIGGIHIGPIGMPWNLREGDAILAKKELSPQWIGRKQLSGGYVGKYITFHFDDANQIIGVRINVNNQPINIYATHWHSSLLPRQEVKQKAKEIYDSGKADKAEYDSLLTIINDGIEWRLGESEKTIQFITETADDYPVILMGDFNALNESQEIKLLEQYGLIDTYKYLYPDSAGYTWDPKTNINQQIHYINNDTTTSQNIFDEIDYYKKHLSKRIDCIFVGDQALISSEKLIITDSKVVMKKIINGVQASDHYGILSVIKINY